MPLKLPVNETGISPGPDTYNILSTGNPQDFSELTTLASAISRTPIALINLIDKQGTAFDTHIGSTILKSDFENSFCVHTLIADEAITIIEDATRDERFAANPFVTGPEKIIFYAGVPLINEAGFVLGSLCVVDRKRKKLSTEQIVALQIVARQVVEKLELRKKAIVSEETIIELRDTNLFMQKFTAMAAHDIKNPLSSILASAQGLQMRLKNLADDGCEKLVTVNISSAQRLIRLIDDMLEYSRKPALLLTKKETIDLNALLQIIISLVHVPARFEIRLPEGSHSLHVSSVAVQQIFINLLTNAIRYNDKAHGLVEIRFREAGENYEFEVSDNGIGIAEAYHEKIFRNSFTLKLADRYAQQGSGIGLSTVKELIKALNGKIRVASVPGEGTTFFVTISK